MRIALTFALLGCLIGAAWGKKDLEVVEHREQDKRYVKLEIPPCKINCDTDIYLGKTKITFDKFWKDHSDGEIVISEVTIKSGKATKVILSEE